MVYVAVGEVKDELIEWHKRVQITQVIGAYLQCAKIVATYTNLEFHEASVVIFLQWKESSFYPAELWSPYKNSLALCKKSVEETQSHVPQRDSAQNEGEVCEKERGKRCNLGDSSQKIHGRPTILTREE